MKKSLLTFVCVTAVLLSLQTQQSLCAQPTPLHDGRGEGVGLPGYTLPEGKEIYIPEELSDNDFTDSTSQWSYYRMAATPNVVCFWEKGFGNDLSKAPDLDGHPMTVDLDNLLARVENRGKRGD